VQFLPYAVAQVFGGSLCIGDNQYLPDAQILFKKKPQHQAADGIGLAGARTCINEVETFKGAAGQIEGVWQGCVACSSGHCFKWFDLK
jgi:hypothetical protein